MAGETAEVVQLSRKGTACPRCHKLKVKCDSADRGMGDCSRCLRLGLQCANTKKTRPFQVSSGPDRQSEMETNIFKHERAIEDILQKLQMPALDLYAQTPMVEHDQSLRSTRNNSQEPTVVQSDDIEKDLSPGPMRSLIEATRLNGLCSQLRSVKQRKKGGMRRMDSDLISEKIVTYDQAQELFQVFNELLSPYLFSGSITPGTALETVRTSSTVLFTAIMLVSALHISGYEQVHQICHSRFLGLVSSAIFDRMHTLDDIRGLCIAAFWQPDLSWKLSGICIRMATELNLHHAFYEVFHLSEKVSDTARKESLEKARLWYLLFVLDHQSSIAYGRPPVMAELRPIKDFEVLLNSTWCTTQDRALIAQVTGFIPLSKALETFGLEPKRTMGSDDMSIITHRSFTEQVRAWRERWRFLGTIELSEGQGSFSNWEVDLCYQFNNLVLNSLVLRGRSLDNLQELPHNLRPLTLKAVEAAHEILSHFVEKPGYREGIVGMPLYFHSMIAFAVVFLMKTLHRWQDIGITIDPAKTTRPLIEGVVKLLRGCKAGADHMVFSMANGFDRMLKTPRLRGLTGQSRIALREAPVLERSNYDETHKNVHLPASWESTIQTLPSEQAEQQQAFEEIGYPSSTAQNNSEVAMSDVMLYENWGFQDEDLWNLNIGYDLLATGSGDYENLEIQLGHELDQQ